MKYWACFFIVLLFTDLVSVYGTYDPPTKQEYDLFNQVLADFKKLDITKKDVSDVISTFEKPLVITFPCNSDDLNNLVVTVINTKLARFNDTQNPEGVVTGGTYTWQCTITTNEGKITIDCNNELKLNPNITSPNIDPRIQRIENLVILYHELLHGQLMIDAIKSSEKWKHDVCNKTPEGNIDYSYSDVNHKIINPLQTKFVSELIEKDGGKMISVEIKPEQTYDGTFTEKVITTQNYPQLVDGVNVTLQALNIENTTLSSSYYYVTFGGNLINKTQSGFAWFYIFNNTQQPDKTKIIPAGLKRIVGLWSDNKAADSDFQYVIDYLMHEGLISVHHTNSSAVKIPQWIKQNASWWYEGKIDDKTFLSEIQYLMSAGIISI